MNTLPSPTQPTRIEPFSPTEISIAWNDGAEFTVPYREVRFYCPCASCVDEHTGQRVIKKETIPLDIRPKDVRTVGRYAVQITWSDRHATGIYHYETLRKICEQAGRRAA
ncbi:MAG: DUF971 domain-containing protein [Oligoflexia bacterium]|nr:DUF971 domain-containing protein [Oligoflexia bacterium]